MKIKVLVENTAEDPNLHHEHGLSLYLEVAGKIVLFDSGQSATFAQNAETMGVDLRQVEMAVLSHGHFDHGGGLTCFLSANPTAPVYMSRHALEPHFNAEDEAIGLDPAFSHNPRVRFTDGVVRLDERITLYAGADWVYPYPVNPYGQSVERQGVHIPEDYRHEQYLLVEQGGKRVLFSGCCHRGVLNIMHWLKPDVLIGGFHFIKLDPDHPADRALLDRTAEALLNYPTVYYTCHCTGAKPYAYLKERMGNRLHYLSTGQTLTID